MPLFLNFIFLLTKSSATGYLGIFIRKTRQATRHVVYRELFMYFCGEFFPRFFLRTSNSARYCPIYKKRRTFPIIFLHQIFFCWCSLTPVLNCKQNRKTSWNLLPGSIVESTINMYIGWDWEHKLPIRTDLFFYFCVVYLSGWICRFARQNFCIRSRWRAGPTALSFLWRGDCGRGLATRTLHTGWC